jgi:hypothetical protein
MGIKFVEEVPAQVKTSKGRTARIVEQLQKNPGKWGIAYRVGSRSLASSRSSALRKLGAEVMTRTENRRIIVYAKVDGEVKRKRARKAE